MDNNRGLFAQWFETESPEQGGNDELHYLLEQLRQQAVVWDELVNRVRSHYFDRATVTAYCRELGYPGAADSLRVLIPADLTTRSGDLGEILAAEFVNEQPGPVVYLKRLRNKDERETALRGDDLVGVGIDDFGRLEVLKGEAKSRRALDSEVLDEAEAKLRQNDGRPSQHTLGLVTSYLLQTNPPLGVAVSKFNLKLLPATISHLIVTLTQSKPRTLFPRRLRREYLNGIARKLVGIVLADHKGTITRVYDDLLNSQSLEHEVT